MYNQNQLARDIKLVSRINVLIGGNPASDHDVKQFQTVTLLRFGLEADLSGAPFEQACVFRRAIGACRSIDLQDYYTDLKVVKNHYIQFVQENPGMTWQRFKHAVSEKVHYKWIFGPLREMFYSPRACLQWLAFDERVLLDSLDSYDTEIASYKENEAQLRHRVYPEALLDDLSRIISQWFLGSSPGLHAPRPKFGPGAVAEIEGRWPSLWKVAGLAPDPETVTRLCSVYGIDPEDLFPEQHNDCFGEAPGSRTNKILFVPKSATKHRVISKEPLWLSWLQQAIKEDLFDFVEKSPEMMTWFSDQSSSRILAMRGSVDSSYATVDFSSASDSVTVALVRSLFKDTYWLEALLLTRSDHAELPNGEIIELEKFAPMGSATCFVVMDVILLSVCEYAVRRRLGRRGRRDDYVVYGDDVIIREDCVEEFLSTVQLLGFSPNMEKTYTGFHELVYRESCGIEALGGCDITPVRYSRFQQPILRYATLKGKPACMDATSVTDIVSADWLSSCCSLINRLQLAGYSLARSVAVQLIQQTVSSISEKSRAIWYGLPRIDESDHRKGVNIPLSVVVPDGTATNYRSKSLCHHDYQWPGYMCYTCVSIPEDWHDEVDDSAYALWFFQSQHLASDSAAVLSGSAGIRSRKWAKKPIRVR